MILQSIRNTHYCSVSVRVAPEVGLINLREKILVGVEIQTVWHLVVRQVIKSLHLLAHPISLSINRMLRN
jgi:hypothetical protein